MSKRIGDPKIELGESENKRFHKRKTLDVIIDERLSIIDERPARKCDFLLS